MKLLPIRLSVLNEGKWMFTQIVERKVHVSISDPWEFVTSNGGTRTGTVMADANVPDGVIVINLDGAVESSGTVVDKVFARLRHARNTEGDLMGGIEVPCNFSSDLDGSALSASQGVVAFIGSLRLLPSEKL